MKNLLAALALSVSTQASATLIDGINFGEGGNIKFVSSIFFNTVFNSPDSQVPNQNGTFDTDVTIEGVGEIQQILNSQNEVLWENGNNGKHLWFDFYDLDTIALQPVFGSTSLFFNVDGRVDFFTHLSEVSLVGDYSVDQAVVRNGEFFLGGIGDFVEGWTVLSTGDGVFNTGSGQFELDLLNPGPAGVRVDTQSIPRTDGSFTDFTFNYSSDAINAGGYSYAGSADISMIATPVPVPFSASLMILAGFIGFAMRKQSP